MSAVQMTCCCSCEELSIKHPLSAVNGVAGCMRCQHRIACAGSVIPELQIGTHAHAAGALQAEAGPPKAQEDVPS